MQLTGAFALSQGMPSAARAARRAPAPGAAAACAARGGRRAAPPLPRARFAGCSGAPWPAACRRGSPVARATGDSGDIGDAYDNLFRSKVFQSEIAVREFDSITSELRQLSMMATKFAEFDVTGKQMYLDKMRASCERYRIFMKRLELSDDPAAREYLRATNAQMLEGGFTLAAMFQGLEASLSQYEAIVRQEEAIVGDPVRHQVFTRALKEQWSQSAMGRIDMSYLGRVMDPNVLNRAQRDPEFFKCIREISDDPTPATLQRWIDHPTIGPLVAEMFKAMMSRSMGS
ncbi:hypothetical protein Rsub_09481 [Raphidocelis subcapitata]|uniref:Uncharacterized protein n=1 Tax=Raphidocelis subcapitata TaxID=307507 RepID=A0A2V0PB36_9CHLO|nr:hypothetical protein Rsub_09481 [Raphidocelis subcapitata]|eukprot:GBF96739.1 hypothetical protein Rsub_09481 [Raphidocelis subcapitata]